MRATLRFMPLSIKFTNDFKSHVATAKRHRAIAM